MPTGYDFCGWATKNNLLCSDGRTIRRGAFASDDGKKVPLVYQHQHNSVDNVLGHAILENRDDGTFAYCYFNGTDAGKTGKELVRHGDICSLSIYANKLKQVGNDVIHGCIREVSLVLAAANPGAAIESVVLEHSDGSSEEEAIIYTGEWEHYKILKHADEAEEETKTETSKSSGKTVQDVVNSMSEKKKNVLYYMVGQVTNGDNSGTSEEEEDSEAISHADSNGETMMDIFNTFTDEEKRVAYFLIGKAIENNKTVEHSYNFEKEGSDVMKQNVFDQTGNSTEVLSHAEISATIADAKKYGSMKASCIAHGIEDIEYLFPEARSLNTPPEWIKRDDGWVKKVMNAVHHTPFSRIKSMFADLTEDDARAKGYIKGNFKKEQVFSLLKRTTEPTTIYKKQKIDRDDMVDITDFDVIAWIKSEMRFMLEEEGARAILVGDGRLSSSDDKIPEDHIRPVWTDADLYTVKVPVTYSTTATDSEKSKAIIRAIIKARKNYKGSGSPTFYTTEDVLTDMLLIEDNNGRQIYESETKLATALRVKEIVTVPVMEGLSRTVTEGLTTSTHELLGIIVNLADYNVGADKGGAVNMFDDFDIDYNAMKYLIETRFSGALIKPYAAMAIEHVTTSTSTDDGD